jgi:hypothetical protein
MSIHELISMVKSLSGVLVGSRMMGCNSITSDYDFLVLYRQEAIDELIKFGFNLVIGLPEDGEYYYSDNLVTFYRAYSSEGIKIEVQVAPTLDLMNIIYDTYMTLRENSTYKLLMKPFRQFLYLTTLDDKIQRSILVSNEVKEISRNMVYNSQGVIFTQLQTIFSNSVGENEITF